MDHALQKLHLALSKDLHFIKRSNLWLAYGRVSGVMFFLEEAEHDILSFFLKGQSIEKIAAMLSVSYDDIINLLKSVVVKISQKKVANDKIMPVNALLLIITNNCNMACTYCYGSFGHNEKKNQMSKDTVRKTIDFCQELNIKQIAFFGGEPLLNFKVIVEAIEYSRLNKFDISFGMTTNGTLVTEEIADYLKKHNVRVSVSIDGPEDIHNISRRYKDNTSTYSDVLNGIAILKDRGILDILEITHSMCHPPTLRKIIKDTCKIWSRVTCTCVEGQKDASFHSEIVKGDRLKIFYNELFDLMVEEKLEKSSQYTSGVFELFDTLMSSYKINRPYFCSGIMNRVTVSPSGKMYPCPETISEKYCFGTVQDPVTPERFDQIRRKQLHDLEKKDKLSHYWFSNLVDTCVVRLDDTSKDSIKIDDADTISECLEDLIFKVAIVQQESGLRL